MPCRFSRRWGRRTGSSIAPLSGRWEYRVATIVNMADSTHIAVLGAGAVGCYFGGMLARAGASVTLIGRPRHVDAIAAGGIRLESIRFHDRVDVAATTTAAAAAGASIVLLTVKGPDTESAVAAL